MKTVALHPKRPEFLRDRQRPRERGHVGVERGVEACDLRYPRPAGLGESYHRQRGGSVERRHGGGEFEVALHVVIDQAMSEELGATMHDPEADGVRRGQLRRSQQGDDRLDSRFGRPSRHR